MTQSFRDFIAILNQMDESLLLWLNSLNTPSLDPVMWLLSDRWVWIPFYMVLTYIVMRRYTWRHGLLCLTLVALLITLSDQTCATVIRPLVMRLRPTTPDNPISHIVHTVNNYHGGRYGFPSCHAANTFALAVFLSLYLRRTGMTILLVTWATVVSYSRIYLGVHYPGDILCGLCIGSFYALCLHGVYRLVSRLHFMPAYCTAR